MAPSDTPSPRRQARGKRRIASILDAAAELFAEVGFEATTTNAIAARAGISPGSLYQFFSNKEAIATALTERFGQRLQSARAGDDIMALASMPLDDAIDCMVDPLIAYYLEHPGFLALATGADQSPRLAAVTMDFREGVVDRAAAVLAVRLPDTSPETRQRYARVSVQLVWALLPLVGAVPLSERADMIVELKAAVIRYLTPIWDSSRETGGQTTRS